MSAAERQLAQSREALPMIAARMARLRLNLEAVERERTELLVLLSDLGAALNTEDEEAAEWAI